MMKWFGMYLFMAILLILPGFSQTRPIEFEDMFAMGRVGDFQISPDGRWVAYTVTFFNLDDNSRNSDLFLVSVDGKIHKQLTYHPKTDTHPRWSKDGKQLAFISTRDGSPQIYVLDIRGGEAKKITDVPTEVAGFSWAPDNRHFVIETSMYPDATTPQESAEKERTKTRGGVKARVIDHLLYRHWNSWRDGKYGHLLLYTADGAFVKDLTPGAYDVPPISLGSTHDYVWAPDAQQICYVQNRDSIVAISTNNDLWLTRISDGSVQQLTTNPGNDNGPRFSPDGKSIAYLSMARAGFESDQQDLIVLDIASGKKRNLTETLDRYVSDFVWSPDSRYIYFYVPHHGRHRLYRVEVKSGKRKLLLENRYVGGVKITPDGKSLVLKVQASNLPYELFRFDIRKKKLSQLTFTNQERLSQLEMNSLEDYWFVGAKGDSVHLLLLKPPFFDKTKKYPLLSLIHGGPQGAWGDDFHYRWNSQMFAAPGYVVIMINFHGSRGYGQKFCDAVSKDWGGAPYQDIMIGTRWALEHFDYLDPQRVGAAGASYGGFMINWIEGHNEGDLFKTLVSHDGVFEQVSMFGSTEELWFPKWEFNGAPWDEGSLYQKWNPINFVEHFHTPMLVIHGEHDYRVPYTQGLQLFTALQLKGVESRLLFFPDEDHFVQKPKNARLWWKTVHEWLARWLHPGK
ncbi:MAG: S9 family peptidase [Calditrichaeota bacterium]|nr:MAG: S9 family peptidase [Calditrichota bacterium]